MLARVSVFLLDACNFGSPSQREVRESALRGIQLVQCILTADDILINSRRPSASIQFWSHRKPPLYIRPVQEEV